MHNNNERRGEGKRRREEERGKLACSTQSPVSPHEVSPSQIGKTHAQCHQRAKEIWGIPFDRNSETRQSSFAEKCILYVHQPMMLSGRTMNKVNLIRNKRICVWLHHSNEPLWSDSKDMSTNKAALAVWKPTWRNREGVMLSKVFFSEKQELVKHIVVSSNRNHVKWD